jgi:hypothetical protein
MKLPEPCAIHTPKDGGYFKYEERMERGAKQRQCPHCLRWYFHGEFGRGWKAGLNPENGIKNIINGKV